MAMMKKKSCVFSLSFVAVFWLWMLFVVAIEGRVVSLLQSYEKSGFRPSFSTIYDTSKYGIFNLNNGLARTPQMGFDSLCFSRVFSMSSFIVLLMGFCQFYIFVCI